MINARCLCAVREKFIERVGSLSGAGFHTLLIGTSLSLTWILFLVWARLLTVSLEVTGGRVGLEHKLQELRNLRVALKARYDSSQRVRSKPVSSLPIDTLMAELYRSAAQQGVHIVEILRHGSGDALPRVEGMRIVATGTYHALLRFLGMIEGMNSNFFVENFLLQRSFSTTSIEELEMILEVSDAHAS